MLIDRAGRFRATIAETGVAETGPNKLTTFIARFLVTEEFREGEWHDISSEAAEITGYFYLERRDGAINLPVIDALKTALGWDGRDPFWLSDTDLRDTIVQIAVTMETYNDTTRPKVRWIDHADAQPNLLPRADSASRAAIMARIGPKLRANAGGLPKPAPAPVAPAPIAPQPTPAPAKECTADEAWAAFVAALGSSAPPNMIEREWFRVLAELFPNKQPDELGPTEWAMMRDEGPARAVPF